MGKACCAPCASKSLGDVSDTSSLTNKDKIRALQAQINRFTDKKADSSVRLEYGPIEVDGALNPPTREWTYIIYLKRANLAAASDPRLSKMVLRAFELRADPEFILKNFSEVYSTIKGFADVLELKPALLEIVQGQVQEKKSDLSTIIMVAAAVAGIWLITRK